MDNRYRFVIVFTTLLSALLMIFLCGLVRDTRREVQALRDVLASKQDLINVAAPRLTMFHEDRCTGCHTERRFAGPHNTRGEIEQALAHMQAMPDARFSDQDMARVHASLNAMRCVQCHGADKLRGLAIKSAEDRMQVIREMISKPGSHIAPDEAEALHRSFEQVLGS